MARIDERGQLLSVSLNPDGLEEIGGMVFAQGVMLCGLPANAAVTASSRADFASAMSDFAIGQLKDGEVIPAKGKVMILSGADLNTFSGTFVAADPMALKR